MKLYNNNIPLNIYDIIYGNSGDVHSKLFNDAITLYCNEHHINKDDNEVKIIDQPNKDDILQPSSAILMYDDKIQYVTSQELSQYWNKNYIENTNKYQDNNIFKELLINGDDKKHIEIEFIDYVNGRVQFKNKFTNKKFFVKFNKLDKNKNYYPQLKNTFTSLYYDNSRRIG